MKTRKRVLGFLWFNGNGSHRVDTWEGRKGLVSTTFKNGGRCEVMKLEPLCFSPPISLYMASLNLITLKNNYVMRWVNVRLFLSAPSIKQPLYNSFYSLRTSSGGVTSTLVLHPLDLIKIRFQGKILGITWLCVTCKCIAMLNVMLYMQLAVSVWRKAKKAINKVRTLLHVYLRRTRIYLSKKVNFSWILPFLVIKKISWTLLSDEKSSPSDGHFYRFLNKIPNHCSNYLH